MKQRMLRPIVYIIAMLIDGCAQPSFYQAGKSLADCRADLLKCLRFPRRELCMQNRGYRYGDMDKLSQGHKRIKVVARSGEYWVLDGIGMTADHPSISSESELRIGDPKEGSPGRIVEYRVGRGDLGTFKITLVYEDDELQ